MEATDPNDLEQLLRRRALTEDAARPDAVERRHASGGRTARENVEDLIDPGSWVEYGRFAIAAQRKRRDVEELIARTPADGLIAGTARIGGRPVAVLSYDYTVLAGTQGMVGHAKKDRLFELIERLRLPVVFFAEGGGGRPGDTDLPGVSWLHTRAFALWARLAGKVPRIAIVHGRCFAGNAVLAGCSDLIVATQGASLGMGGPAMIAGGGLGDVAPDDIGPMEMQAPNGVVDLVVADEAEAVAVTKRLLGCFGPVADAWAAPDQPRLRDVLPESPRRAYDVVPVIEGPRRRGLRDRPARALRARARHRAGADRGPPRRRDRQQHQGARGRDHRRRLRQGRRFLQLCDAFGLPIVSLVDTPGFMVGPKHEATGLVRRASALLTAGAALTVPLVAVVLRRAYGLGAQAMVAGSLHEPLLTVAWPSATLGPMGLEGAIRLALRKELEAIEDEEAREQHVRELTAAALENARALNAAQLFELDDVVDPADTRRLIAATLAAAA